MSTPRTSLHALTDRLPFFHPQPYSSPKPGATVSFDLSSPRASRDWSLDNSRRTSIGLPTPGGSVGGAESGFALLGFGRGWDRRRGHGHRRQLSLSSFSLRGVVWVFVLGVVVLGLAVGWLGKGGVWSFNWARDGQQRLDDGSIIPLGQSRDRDGREVFWWEGFKDLIGYYRGWKQVVPFEDWISEQDGGVELANRLSKTSTGGGREPVLVDLASETGTTMCYIDEQKRILPPKVRAFAGLPQGFPAPLFGSHETIGLKNNVCYDRLNRFGPYGYGFAEEEGGLGIKLEGDIQGRDDVQTIDYRSVRWGEAQEKCIASKQFTGPRTAFIIRTWHRFEYSPYHIMMLRAIISELTLRSGGRYFVHFLIHVQDDTIPIWASDEIYDEVLESSLPAEFAGMGTLWSVAQMKFIYPPPFPDSIVNFSGDDVYKAYRSLHFPLQYFAQKHAEFEYFWHWEMDIRVTGDYLELLDRITLWAETQERDLMWEKSSKFFIPALYNNSYLEYETVVKNEHGLNSKVQPITGPQLPEAQRLSIPGVTNKGQDDRVVDLITFSPLFDPRQTRWAFHDDITGYPPESRPPTRAALITATRLSRRLLLTMHHETYANKHTMFPEMYPASVALHYGFKAVYAPLPIYFDRDWPAQHADEVFNNAVIGDEARRAGMDHGSGHFHGEGGSVFGPGEHVFRGASWYSNALFAGYLWRRWLGREDARGEIAWESDPTRGRMCLPMMVLHPVKHE